MSLKDEDPHLYQIAKQMVLGLGFGMGAERFAEICRRFGITLTRPTSVAWREAITKCFEAGPGRDRMFRMFSELEQAGAETTFIGEDVRIRVSPPNLSAVRRVIARRLPKTLKVVQNTPGSFSIVANE